MLRIVFLFLLSISIPAHAEKQTGLELNDQGYFSMPGLDVTFFADVYPDGHQTGVTVIQHGRRVAANGDLRLEASPGQWSPVPRSHSQQRDDETQTLTQVLAYPDPTKNRKGFNPIEYPDLKLNYQVHIRPLENNSFEVRVDLNQPLPKNWVGKVGFHFELFPLEYFGASYQIGEHFGVFARQPNGPISMTDNGPLGEPMGRGKRLVIAAENPLKRMTIESTGTELMLLDGRSNHNNGWFIVRSSIPAGATNNAIRWIITPNVVPEWRYQPVMQLSQVGYRSRHPKRLIIEQDKRDQQFDPVHLYQVTREGDKPVFKGTPKNWGQFLRYQYAILDFTYLDKPGIYVAEYRGQRSHPFKIGEDVFARNVWQPTLEYFLPVQMCHMRVEQKYRVWHDLCHQDDALMSPVNHNHFDGYISGPSTFTHYQPGEAVPKLNHGGWHDAGDYDIRVESQAGTVWLLSAMIEEFDLALDSTSVDQTKQLVEIHKPDGISDAVQQVEHGLLSMLGAYQSMGRLYRGIIASTLKQYVLLGDASAQTNGKVEPTAREENATSDDRWVFTEDNPDRTLHAVGAIAAGARVVQRHNPELAKLAATAAQDLFERDFLKATSSGAKVFALTELHLLTGEEKYLDLIYVNAQEVLANIENTAWRLARIRHRLTDQEFGRSLDDAVGKLQNAVRQQASETPYGVPYQPNIWGAGWGIQEFGVRQYFMHKAWPQHTDANIVLNALNFVLGVHPGENTISFASGVGAHSALVAYGVNRADWSHIPGGVISGTALIRPDLPELKNWPFFWQQTEYVMGGGATNFMFLVLAAHHMN